MNALVYNLQIKKIALFSNNFNKITLMLVSKLSIFLLSQHKVL